MAPREKGRLPFTVGVEYLDKTDIRFLKLPGQLRDWQIRCVCEGTHETCNGGWMKEIEDRAKPI